MKGTALITGGARRIGRAIALSLVGRGYKIALHYHSSQQDAEKAASDIRSKGVDCELFQCDLSHSGKVATLIPRVFERFPDCNLLVNNASVFQRARLMETDEALFDRHFDTNFKAPFFLSRDFAQHCRKGHIINILDTKISRTLIEYFAYTLTKKALYEFTRMAAKELGPSIRVNGVSPGLILPSADLGPEDFKKMGDRVPLKTTGNPESIVSAIDFLIDNTFITGECIFVDGGEHLK
jgi:NAD(P)-dependent dehydrogenase (short-subunit alcohol dehydrogenase family)